MKVSALVSAYYASEFLEGRLRNLEDVEIVVVCQAGSEEEEIARQFPVELIRTSNVPTLYEAWDMAVDRASGDYLTSANCDDRFYPGMLSAMAKHLDSHDCGIAHGDCDIRTGNQISPWKRKPPSVSPTHCTVGSMPMWRKSLHKKYGYFDPAMKVCGDFEFWLRVQTAGEKICHLDLTVGTYWQRKDSIEHRNQVDMYRENELIRKKYQ